MIGVEDSTDSSPNDHPGDIWLVRGWVEMSEPDEGASQEHEATATGLLHCDTSSSDDNKPYGWAEGTDYSNDVSDTNKRGPLLVRTTTGGAPIPPPLCWGKGGSQVWQKLPTPALHLGAIHKYQE